MNKKVIPGSMTEIRGDFSQLRKDMKRVKKAMSYPHIHTPNDGRPPRKVFLDGRLVERGFFADTKHGIVRRYRAGHLLDKSGERILSETRHGKVTVVFTGD